MQITFPLFDSIVFLYHLDHFIHYSLGEYLMMVLHYLILSRPWLCRNQMPYATFMSFDKLRRSNLRYDCHCRNSITNVFSLPICYCILNVATSNSISRCASWSLFASVATDIFIPLSVCDTLSMWINIYLLTQFYGLIRMLRPFGQQLLSLPIATDLCENQCFSF